MDVCGVGEKRKSVFGVGFDFDHTLGLDNRLERTALLNVLGRCAATKVTDRTAWEKAVDTALNDYRSGHHSLHDALQQLFQFICGELCDDEALFDRFVEETMLLAPAHVKAIDGACELLARLEAAGVPTAILTNGWNPLQQKKADLIGYRGPVIVSDDLGIRKPDGRAFGVLSAALETPPEHIIYVGDTPDADIVGALHAGMQAVWFDWESREYGTDFPQPSCVIHALNEVDGLVFSQKT